MAPPSSLLAVSTGTTTIIVVALLLAVAVAMIVLARWLVQRTRRDPPALGPLEVMADRSWRNGEAERRVELLAAARPDGALAPAPMLEYEPDAGPEDPTPAEEERPDEPAAADEERADEPAEATATDDATPDRYDPSDG